MCIQIHVRALGSHARPLLLVLHLFPRVAPDRHVVSVEGVASAASYHQVPGSWPGQLIAMHCLSSELPLSLSCMQSPLPCAVRRTKHKTGLFPPRNPGCVYRCRKTYETDGGGLVGAGMLASCSELRACLLLVQLGSKWPSCTYLHQSHENASYKCLLKAGLISRKQFPASLHFSPKLLIHAILLR